MVKKIGSKSFAVWILLLVSCARNAGNTSLRPFRIIGSAQGTSYAVTYYSQTEQIKKPPIDSIFNRIDQSLSIYQPGSLISRFNASERGIVPDLHLRKVVGRSLEIFRDTRGVFDITVYPLVQAWGFGTVENNALPDSAFIRSLLHCIGSDKIVLSKSNLEKRASCTKIDVNGIAQGYSVDVVAGFLEQNGIHNYLVEVGGEIRVKGRKYPENQPFSIGIETPSKSAFSQDGIRKVIQLENGAVTTSGSYRKFRQSGSKQISHIIDPQSGFPAQTDLVSVTVYARDAVTADGYDNALLAMGLEKSLVFLSKRKDLQAYFIYRQTDGTLADTATAGFHKFYR